MLDLSSLQATLGYHFSDVTLLDHALTHRSVQLANNERLEFLGDAVLGMIMADLLYRRYPELTEGELSRVRSGLVNGEMLALVAREIKLGAYLKLSAGEVKSGGSERDSILADAIEALIAAIYLDGGLDAASMAVCRLFGEARLATLKEHNMEKDPKSALQEWLQARKLPLPDYELSVTGKAHEQVFHVVCRVSGLPHEARGESMSRRKAERVAAAAFLKELQDS